MSTSDLFEMAKVAGCWTLFGVAMITVLVGVVERHHACFWIGVAIYAVAAWLLFYL